MQYHLAGGILQTLSTNCPVLASGSSVQNEHCTVRTVRYSSMQTPELLGCTWVSIGYYFPSENNIFDLITQIFVQLLLFQRWTCHASSCLFIPFCQAHPSLCFSLSVQAAHAIASQCNSPPTTQGDENGLNEKRAGLKIELKKVRSMWTWESQLRRLRRQKQFMTSGLRMPRLTEIVINYAAGEQVFRG